MNCSCKTNIDIDITSELQSLNATLSKVQQCLEGIDARLTALADSVGDWYDGDSDEEEDYDDE